MKNVTDIKLLVLDVDGVLTDGKITYTAAADGGLVESKSFSVRDGAGMKYWTRVGGTLAWITGRGGAAVEHRAKELGAALLKQNALVKLPVFEETLTELGFTLDQTAVIGDDLPDLPLFRAAGFAACPADAAPEVIEAADYVCKLPGGAGAVREVVELILKAQGQWDTIMTRYL